MSLTTEQVLELIERSRDDRAIIVGSEVRQLAGLALRALDDSDRYARQESAATILAAFILAHAIANTNNGETLRFGKDYPRQAVEMADALRAELGKTGGGGK